MENLSSENTMKQDNLKLTDSMSLEEASWLEVTPIMPGSPLLAQDHFVNQTSSRTLNYCEVWESVCVKS